MKAFTNPLINADFPDPSVLYVEGDGYYAYGTHDEMSPTVNSIQVSYSKDLVHWTKPTEALKVPPHWAKTCQKFWAPHVVKVEDEYRMYYSAEPDHKLGMSIALATSTKPLQFEDIGVPLFSGDSYKMIDPCYFVDPVSGKHFLYYGSAHEPIRVVEMNRDGRTIMTEPINLVYPDPGKPYESLREGAFVSYKAEWNRYYLWVSGNNTWKSGEYGITLFYSDSPTGPFERYGLVLKEGEEWDAPGQNCILGDYIFYHAVDRKDPYLLGTNIFMRKMCGKQLLYSREGWPSLGDKTEF